MPPSPGRLCLGEQSQREPAVCCCPSLRALRGFAWNSMNLFLPLPAAMIILFAVCFLDTAFLLRLRLRKRICSFDVMKVLLLQTLPRSINRAWLCRSCIWTQIGRMLFPAMQLSELFLPEAHQIPGAQCCRDGALSSQNLSKAKRLPLLS